MRIRNIIDFGLVFCIAFVIFLASCSDDDPFDFTEDNNETEENDDESSSDDSGAPDHWEEIFNFEGDTNIQVIGEYRKIPADEAPMNPITGDKTPAEMNVVGFYRFRASTSASLPRTADSVLLLLPGYTVGANSLIYMAKNMVFMSGGAIEVWVMDHRHNLMEDNFGMDIAETLKNPRLAFGYYFEGLNLFGKTFQGFPNSTNSDTGMMSEWGVDLEMKDIDRLVHRIRMVQPGAAIFLGGHSRGVISVKGYAAYKFPDGRLGCENLSGIVLIDGEGRYRPWMDEGEYLEALRDLRSGRSPRYTTFYPLGPSVYTMAEILSMAASKEFEKEGDDEVGPKGIFPHMGPLGLLLPITYRFKDIKMNNEALVGFLIDDQSSLIGILRAHVGQMNGPTAQGNAGEYPTDESILYSWKQYNKVSPAEDTDIQDVLQAIYKGPSNALDPYYSSRLPLDFAAAGLMETEGTWRGNYFKFYTSEMDVPVFALATRIISGTNIYETYRDSLPPVRGQDLPRTEYGFRIDRYPGWEHIDTIFAKADRNKFFYDLIDWITELSSPAKRQATVTLPNP